MRRGCSRPSSAYLLFVAAGSPALGEEGFAPAGSIFAAGVLAFAAAVPPATAASRWVCGERIILLRRAARSLARPRRPGGGGPAGEAPTVAM